MFRRSTLIIPFVFLLLFSSCQSYTSGLQQSVARADETAALAALHAIALAQRTYSLTNSGEYGTLKQLTNGGFLDARYDGDKPIRDYVVKCTVTPKPSGAPEGSYSCNADPDKPTERPGRHLYIESVSDGIHVNDTQPATAADKVMQ
jgi:type II secretory pathway pseudopilin PulG